MAHPLIKFTDSICVQEAIHWRILSGDGRGGDIIQDGSPSIINVRWNNEPTIIRDSGRDIGRGDESINQGVVLIKSNAGDMDIGDYLFLIRYDANGQRQVDLSDLTEEERKNPRLMNKARRIITIKETPMFKSKTEFIRRAYLEPQT